MCKQKIFSKTIFILRYPVIFISCMFKVYLVYSRFFLSVPGTSLNSPEVIKMPGMCHGKPFITDFVTCVTAVFSVLV